MWADLIPVEKSYFPHLSKSGVNMILDLRYDSSRESVRDLHDNLFRILKLTESENFKWIFSFVGSPVKGQNLSVINFFDDHQFEAAFRMTEMYKKHCDEPASFTEISFVCSLALLEKFLKEEELNFAWDFQLGGWLVQKNAASGTFNELKFNNGFQYNPSNAQLGFCSSDDWDCIQFFPAQENFLKNIQNEIANFKNKIN